MKNANDFEDSILPDDICDACALQVLAEALEDAEGDLEQSAAIACELLDLAHHIGYRTGVLTPPKPSRRRKVSADIRQANRDRRHRHRRIHAVGRQ